MPVEMQLLTVLMKDISSKTTALDCMWDASWLKKSLLDKKAKLGQLRHTASAAKRETDAS